jgi:hypothetical protein
MAILLYWHGITCRWHLLRGVYVSMAWMLSFTDIGVTWRVYRQLPSYMHCKSKSMYQTSKSTRWARVRFVPTEHVQER